MLMNYHELTMNEARDSPARRKQFLLICVVMAGAMMYSIITAGGFTPVEFTEGNFPGGEYVYKFSKRDYAAANGLARSIGRDLDLNPRKLADVIYNIYLDHPGVVTGGRQQRFAAGLLVKKGDNAKLKSELMAKNDFVVPFTEEEFWELAARELWPKIKYEATSLPKTKAAIVQFPFTDGFVSSLILTWKIIPAFHKYVQENSSPDTPVIVISTCSVPDQMCTHYAPLSKVKPFLLGKKGTKEYAETLAPEKLIDFTIVGATLRRIVPFYGYFEALFSGGHDEL